MLRPFLAAFSEHIASLPPGKAATAKGYAGVVPDDLNSGQPFSENLFKHI